MEAALNDVVLIKRAFRKANIADPLRVVDDGDIAVKYFCGDVLYLNRALYPLPVLILLDLKLPGKSRLEMLEWIRQHHQPGKITVIILTCSRENSDLDRAYEIVVNSCQAGYL